jgi:hypothetical protein
MLYCDGRGRDIRTVEDCKAVLHLEKHGFPVAQIPVPALAERESW